jgi:hypothetical protein
MERFQASWETAQRKLKVADHMLTMTYPLVNDPKLLLNITVNILESMESAMSSVLEFERLFKRVPPYDEDFDGKLVVFQQSIVPEKNIPRNYVVAMNELRELIRYHKDSHIEFVRKDRMVMADDNYRLKTLSPGDIKKRLQTAKDFLHLVGPMVTDERSAA